MPIDTMVEINACLAALQQSLEPHPELAERVRDSVRQAMRLAGENFPGVYSDGPPDGSRSYGLAATVWPDGQAVVRCSPVICVREPDPDADDPGDYRWGEPGFVIAAAPAGL